MALPVIPKLSVSINPITGKSDAQVVAESTAAAKEAQRASDAYTAEQNLSKEGGFDLSQITASFATGLKTMQETQKKMAEQYPDVVDTTTKLQTAEDTQAAAIRSSFGSAKEDIESQTKQGFALLAKTGDRLQLSPAQIKYNVDNYKDAVADFTTKSNNAIKDLTIQEEAAMANNDINYANQIRQTKLDYINFQRQSMSDSLNFITTAYNAILTGQQMKQQTAATAQTTASNQFNAIIQAYAGKGLKYSSLPVEVQETLKEASNTLGIPISSMDAMLTPAPKTDNFTQFEQMANLSTVVSDYLTASVGKQDKFVDVIDYAQALEMWKQRAPGQLKSFFIAYPSSRYLNPNEIDPYRIQAATSIKEQEKTTINKTDTGALLEMFINQMSASGT
jgi:hypothetical protein